MFYIYIIFFAKVVVENRGNCVITRRYSYIMYIINYNYIVLFAGFERIREQPRPEYTYIIII